MVRLAVILFPLRFLIVLALAPSVYADGYARVSVALADKEDNERPFTETSSPISGEKLNIYFDTNRECVVLVVPFAIRGQKMANRWRPQMAVLKEWEERKLPQYPIVWDWSKTSEAFEFWVFFFRSDAAGLGEMRSLIAAMQNPQLDDKVLAQQTRLLHELLGDRMSGTARVVHGPKASANPSGGAVRADEFPWRDFAYRVELNNALEGLLVIRHGR
jgi:hypothetical protein